MKVKVVRKWSKIIKCRGCKSTLELEEGDVRWGGFSCMGEVDYNFYIDCVECGTTNILGYDLPGYVEDLAKSKSKE